MAPIGKLPENIAISKTSTTDYAIDQLKDNCLVSWLELNRGRKSYMTNNITEYFLCQQKAS